MDVEALKSELTYKAVRSSGSGGQNVNKVASKVVLYFNLEASEQFTDDEKARLTEFFQNRLNKQGVLILDSSESRSQFRNKALVTQKFLDLIIKWIFLSHLMLRSKTNIDDLIALAKNVYQTFP